MSEMWKKWEGQVVDHKYQLRQYQGSTDHSVVFLAEFRDPEVRRVAIKFISADFPGKDQQLAAWSQAAQLIHPNLIRIYGSGQYKIEDLDLLYVAMEYAEENLAQVLPHRALMPEEATEMLNSIVDVLAYLHGKHLTHGHVKPSNVLAINELLKLSSDTIFPLDDVRDMRRERSAYDAPELPDSPYTPAADIWSLGVTLVEALTQQPAILPFNEQAEPIIPPAVHEPFLEIARHTLQRERRLRWSSAKIAERLNPEAAAAKAVAASAGVSAGAAVVSASAGARAAVAAPPAPPVMAPLNVPLSKEPAVPQAKLPPAPSARPAVPRTPFSEEGVPPSQTMVLPNYAIPLFVSGLVVIALILLVVILHRRSASEASTVSTLAPATTQQGPANEPSPQTSNAQPPAKPPASLPEPSAQIVTPPQPVAPAPAPATSSNAESSAVLPPKNANASPGNGEALDQVAPQVPAKALATIHGTVRVAVKVHVDASGNVAEAALDAPGPSKYFADLALKAARQWVFTPPEAEGRSVASDWRIQFNFTPSGVQKTVQQISP
jgi:eukaryotic-like serine/threonine-protein kinase